MQTQCAGQGRRIRRQGVISPKKKGFLPAQASSNIKPILALSGPYPLHTPLCKNFSRGHLAHWLIWPSATQGNMKPILALSGPHLLSTPLCKIFSRGHLAHLFFYAPATIPTPRPSLAYLAHKPFNTTLPRSQVIPVIAMLPMTAITSPSIIGPIISQGNLPTLISTWPNFCGPLLILVGPVTDWCQPAKIFCPRVLVKIWR